MACETLNARIDCIIYHGQAQWSPAGEKFLVALTDNGSKIKGRMERVEKNQDYCLIGEWKYNPKRNETAFEFDTFHTLIDQSADGLTTYLATYIDGLGPTKARAIVEHFGDETLAVLETDPDRCVGVPGGVITPKILATIKSHFADSGRVDIAAFASLKALFVGHVIRKSIVVSLCKVWGASASDVVKDRPYSILLPYPGMGWKTVDAIATGPTVGYAKDGIDRQMAAILEALTKIAGDGHTYATRVDAEGEAFRLIGMMPSSSAWDSLAERRKVVLRAGKSGLEVALAALDAAERSIALSVARISAGGSPLEFSLDAGDLNGDQRHALDMVENHAIGLLAGPPGCGKSYTIAAIIAALVARGVTSIQVVAPTGKAAKRAEELVVKALGGKVTVPCSTIHRALGPAPSEAEGGTPSDAAKPGRGRDEFGFARNAASPLQAEWLIADELSMVPVELGASLLDAVATGTRVILVGDENQLPSVGAGSMLRDLLASGSIPRVTLDKIVRSESAGRVVKACHAIKDGRRPEPAGKIDLPADNWVHIELDDPAAIASKIVELVRPRAIFPDVFWDLQVISAQRKVNGGPIGTNALNRMLADKLNPRPPADGSAGAADADFEPKFIVGDKVIRRKNGKVEMLVPETLQGTKNGHDDDDRDSLVLFTFEGIRHAVRATTVVNGDMGTVRGIVEDGRRTWIVVAFRTPDRLVRLPIGDHELQLAYAITTHLSQGSGYPLVITPVHNSFFFDDRKGIGMWSRELVYTAISRAEALLITVGQMSAIDMAVRRKTLGRRRTRLVERLAEAMPAAGDVPFGGAEEVGGVEGAMDEASEPVEVAPGEVVEVAPVELEAPVEPPAPPVVIEVVSEPTGPSSIASIDPADPDAGDLVASVAQVINPFTVVIDTREQAPYEFLGLRGDHRRPISVPTVRLKLDRGDYGIFGLPGVAIERKSKADLFASVAKRANFERRLAAMSELRYAAIVVEAEVSEILRDPPEFTKFKPKSLIRTVMAWDQRYAVRWWFLPGRAAAEQCAFRLLERFFLDRKAEMGESPR